MSDRLYRIENPDLFHDAITLAITLKMIVPVEPDAWGITTWRQLYETMTVAETIGDFVECTDALGAALGIGDTNE